jgi:hypothetical protein
MGWSPGRSAAPQSLRRSAVGTHDAEYGNHERCLGLGPALSMQGDGVVRDFPFQWATAGRVQAKCPSQARLSFLPASRFGCGAGTGPIWIDKPRPFLIECCISQTDFGTCDEQNVVAGANVLDGHDRLGPIPSGVGARRGILTRPATIEQVPEKAAPTPMGAAFWLRDREEGLRMMEVDQPRVRFRVAAWGMPRPPIGGRSP